jgi:hypothetical protein
MRPDWKSLVVAVGSAAALSSAAQAQILLGVTRVDNNGAALSNAASNTFIDWFFVTPTTATYNTTVNASQLGLITNAGNATSEGHLTLSQDGRYLTWGGYNAPFGTAAIAGTAGTSFQRKVGLMDFAGNVTTTLLPTTIGGNPRSAVSTNGSDIWVGTSAAGTQYTAFGSGTSTQLSTAPTNTRVTNIFGGQLYVSSASAPFDGVATVGSGTPTTSGQTTTLLPGFPTANGPSSYDYVLVNASTLVVADDRTASPGGLEKWTLSAGTWSLSYSALGGASSNIGMRGLTYDPNTTTFYATGSDGNLYSGTDTGTTFTFNQLFTASTLGANDQFRGLDFVPVPEPTTMVLAGLAGASIAARLVRRKRLTAKTA